MPAGLNDPGPSSILFNLLNHFNVWEDSVIHHRSNRAFRVVLLGTAIALSLLFSGIGCSKDKKTPTGPGSTTVLYTNGSFVTHPDQGFGGADASALHDGLNVLGFSCDSGSYMIADEFTIPDPQGWYINEMTFFVYQPDSDTISTITGLYVQIWNGRPDSVGSAVVWGSRATNILKTSVWSGCYRTNAADTATAHTRPIMATTCNVNDPLPAGTYWVEFSVNGSLASGPYTVPLDTLGVTVTGNAIRYNNTVWTAVVDGGAQGFPFLIQGYKP
jgi:hypothetical protein